MRMSIVVRAISGSPEAAAAAAHAGISLYTAGVHPNVITCIRAATRLPQHHSKRNASKKTRAHRENE